MLVSAHVADIGRSAALRKAPAPGSVPGLRQAHLALTAPLGGSLRPSLDKRRVAFVAFWDDDAALDGFLAGHPLAERLSSGFHVRLAPLRAFGSWPGLPDDLPAERSVPHEGPAAVMTIGRLRLTQAVRFLRTSAKAEARVLGAPGLAWATGFARPPLVGTFSLWEDSRSLATYAYGAKEPAHPEAIAEGDRKPFHHRSAFVRFRPYRAEGSLGGANPLPESLLTPA